MTICWDSCVSAVCYDHFLFWYVPDLIIILLLLALHEVVLEYRIVMLRTAA